LAATSLYENDFQLRLPLVTYGDEVKLLGLLYHYGGDKLDNSFNMLPYEEDKEVRFMWPYYVLGGLAVGFLAIMAFDIPSLNT